MNSDNNIDNSNNENNNNNNSICDNNSQKQKIVSLQKQLYINFYQINRKKVMNTERKLERQNKGWPHNDLIYHVKCPQCHDDYIGDIGRKCNEKMF